MTTSRSFSHSALPTFLATSLVVLAGCAAIGDATMGWQVVSTEDGRRLAIARAPRVLPPVTLDLPGWPLLGDWLRTDARVTIVVFIYTSCNAVCSVLGSEFQRMQAAIVERGLQDRVRLVSISFDPRDGAPELAAYALRQKANPAIWQFAGVASAAQRQAMLDAFGIVVVPAPLGEFVHNAAFHIVGPDARLAKISDYDQPERALAEALAMHARSGR